MTEPEYAVQGISNLECEPTRTLRELVNASQALATRRLFKEFPLKSFSVPLERASKRIYLVSLRISTKRFIPTTADSGSITNKIHSDLELGMFTGMPFHLNDFMFAL